MRVVLRQYETPSKDVQLALKIHKEKDDIGTEIGDNNILQREKRTSPTSEGDNNFKATCAGSDETIRRGHCGHLTSIGEDDRRPYGDGSTTLTRDKNAHVAPTKHTQYSMPAPQYGGPMTFITKGNRKNL